MEKITNILSKKEVPIKLLNFPDVRQSTADRCGIDAVQTVLQYYGEDYREDELILSLRNTDTYISDNRGAASTKNIITLFEDKGFKVNAKERMTINDLINYLNRDIPIIMLIQAWGDLDDYSEAWIHGHYVVAEGYTRNKIIFEDPSSFNVTYLTFDDLMTRWHDQDDYRKYINYGIAVYGKKPIFDKNKWVPIG
jgi:predicted double-glycine peptidase